MKARPAPLSAADARIRFERRLEIGGWFTGAIFAVGGSLWATNLFWGDIPAAFRPVVVGGGLALFAAAFMAVGAVLAKRHVDSLAGHVLGLVGRLIAISATIPLAILAHANLLLAIGTDAVVLFLLANGLRFARRRDQDPDSASRTDKPAPWRLPVLGLDVGDTAFLGLLLMAMIGAQGIIAGVIVAVGALLVGRGAIHALTPMALDHHHGHGPGTWMADLSVVAAVVAVVVHARVGMAGADDQHLVACLTALAVVVVVELLCRLVQQRPAMAGWRFPLGWLLAVSAPVVAIGNTVDAHDDVAALLIAAVTWLVVVVAFRRSSRLRLPRPFSVMATAALSTSAVLATLALLHVWSWWLWSPTTAGQHALAATAGLLTWGIASAQHRFSHTYWRSSRGTAWAHAVGLMCLSIAVPAAVGASDLWSLVPLAALAGLWWRDSRVADSVGWNLAAILGSAPTLVALANLLPWPSWRLPTVVTAVVLGTLTVAFRRRRRALATAADAPDLRRSTGLYGGVATSSAGIVAVVFLAMGCAVVAAFSDHIGGAWRAAIIAATALLLLLRWSRQPTIGVVGFGAFAITVGSGLRLAATPWFDGAVASVRALVAVDTVLLGFVVVVVVGLVAKAHTQGTVSTRLLRLHLPSVSPLMGRTRYATSWAATLVGMVGLCALSVARLPGLLNATAEWARPAFRDDAVVLDITPVVAELGLSLVFLAVVFLVVRRFRSLPHVIAATTIAVLAGGHLAMALGAIGLPTAFPAGVHVEATLLGFFAFGVGLSGVVGSAILPWLRRRSPGVGAIRAAVMARGRRRHGAKRAAAAPCLAAPLWWCLFVLVMVADVVGVLSVAVMGQWFFAILLFAVWSGVVALQAWALAMGAPAMVSGRVGGPSAKPRPRAPAPSNDNDNNNNNNKNNNNDDDNDDDDDTIRPVNANGPGWLVGTGVFAACASLALVATYTFQSHQGLSLASMVAVLVVALVALGVSRLRYRHPARPWWIRAWPSSSSLRRPAVVVVLTATGALAVVGLTAGKGPAFATDYGAAMLILGTFAVLFALALWRWRRSLPSAVAAGAIVAMVGTMVDGLGHGIGFLPPSTGRSQAMVALLMPLLVLGLQADVGRRFLARLGYGWSREVRRDLVRFVRGVAVAIGMLALVVTAGFMMDAQRASLFPSSVLVLVGLAWFLTMVVAPTRTTAMVGSVGLGLLGLGLGWGVMALLGADDGLAHLSRHSSHPLSHHLSGALAGTLLLAVLWQWRGEVLLGHAALGRWYRDRRQHRELGGRRVAAVDVAARTTGHTERLGLMALAALMVVSIVDHQPSSMALVATWCGAAMALVLTGRMALQRGSTWPAALAQGMVLWVYVDLRRRTPWLDDVDGIDAIACLAGAGLCVLISWISRQQSRGAGMARAAEIFAVCLPFIATTLGESTGSRAVLCVLGAVVYGVLSVSRRHPMYEFLCGLALVVATILALWSQGVHDAVSILLPIALVGTFLGRRHRRQLGIVGSYLSLWCHVPLYCAAAWSALRSETFWAFAVGVVVVAVGVVYAIWVRDRRSLYAAAAAAVVLVAGRLVLLGLDNALFGTLLLAGVGIALLAGMTIFTIRRDVARDALAKARGGLEDWE